MLRNASSHVFNIEKKTKKQHCKLCNCLQTACWWQGMFQFSSIYWVFCIKHHLQENSNLKAFHTVWDLCSFILLVQSLLASSPSKQLEFILYLKYRSPNNPELLCTKFSDAFKYLDACRHRDAFLFKNEIKKNIYSFGY